MSRVEICSEQDIVLARQVARQAALNLGFSLVDQTRIITAVSELARNIYTYATSGSMQAQELKKATGIVGLEFVFEDQGPGIDDLQLALTAGYSSGQGLGLGLSGAKRLMDEFELQSKLGQGTLVRVVKWTK
ncbi:serine/threonine-protein kinase RsbT [Desulfosporosinus hippei DSM 8344]|uniref:Serine/threonine-protein kinase RsbT n=1 Tax=Desulfosporosinus hippei DSM 8344 TaxID=1121419 RepID=A0A1G7WBI7_9FIRM|nr:serine/threonine-protein kinase RsbT [Desulfosporosinus hippei DSM 8344]